MKWKISTGCSREEEAVNARNGKGSIRLKCKGKECSYQRKNDKIKMVEVVSEF